MAFSMKTASFLLATLPYAEHCTAMACGVKKLRTEFCLVPYVVFPFFFYRSSILSNSLPSPFDGITADQRCIKYVQTYLIHSLTRRLKSSQLECDSWDWLATVANTFLWTKFQKKVNSLRFSYFYDDVKKNGFMMSFMAFTRPLRSGDVSQA